MKKAIYPICCAMVLALGLAACGDDSGETPASSTSTETATDTSTESDADTTAETDTATDTTAETDTATDTTAETATETDTDVETSEETDSADTDTATDSTEETEDNTETQTETDPGTSTDPDAVPVYTCPEDDIYEDNESEESATPLPINTTLHAIACSYDGEYNHDADIYRIEVEAGCMIDIEARFVHADGDLDMNLTRSGEVTYLGEGGESEDDNENIIYTASVTETVYLTVFPYMSMGNQYALTMMMACP